ncbi:unnamed protein product [Allacma fusca]|uniref:Adaptive response protein AidB N-terminal domain-containing protein n=1 Tax=Allacma fusca TaxID=39272 RepID=A0A8J2J718_9HEXA|nr:unnamed protein product [Allacma fusca]
MHSTYLNIEGRVIASDLLMRKFNIIYIGVRRGVLSCKNRVILLARQGQPKLGNSYLNDGFLQRVLKRILPEEAFAEINSDLTGLGARCVTEIQAHGDQVESNQPYVKQCDAWGNRIDQVVMVTSWSKLKGIAEEDGLVL